MNQFSFGSAWSKGVGLFTGNGGGQAIILIGIGVVIPFLLQYALVGGPASMMNPGLLAGGDSMAALAGGGGGVLMLAMIAGYVLQIGSYFGSWRLGLAPGENVPGALVYGLLAGLLVVIGLGVALVLLAMAFATVAGTAGMLLFVIVLLLLFAFLYTLVAATVAVAMFLLLFLSMILGVSLGQAGFAATLVGGSGVAVVILIVMSVFLLWLAARFSCITSVMADRKSFNPFAAAAESWRLTGDEQFRIMLYLGLIGLVLTVIAFIGLFVAGLGMAASMQGGAAAPEVGMGAMILTLIIGIPFAFLTVLVPGGIYRELSGSTVSAEVFA